MEKYLNGTSSKLSAFLLTFLVFILIGSFLVLVLYLQNKGTDGFKYMFTSSGDSIFIWAPVVYLIGAVIVSSVAANSKVE